jgi:hypothetical protein
MRQYLARKRDTLNEAAISGNLESELNYRTQPGTAEKDRAFAIAVTICACVTLGPLVSVLSWLLEQWYWLVAAVMLLPATFYFTAAAVTWLASRPRSSRWTGFAFVLALAVIALRYFFPQIETSPFYRTISNLQFPFTLALIYPALLVVVIFLKLSAVVRALTPLDALSRGAFWSSLFVLALLASAPSHFAVSRLALLFPIVALNTAFARIVAIGYAHWCAVNPCNSLATMRHWQAAWSRTPLNYHVPVLALAATLWLNPGQMFRPLEGLIGVAVYHIILVLIALALSFRRSGADRSRRVPLGIHPWKAAQKALTVWLTYNRHRTTAPGVFQLPLMPAFDSRHFTYFVLLALNVAAVIPLVRIATPAPAASLSTKTLTVRPTSSRPQTSVPPQGRYQPQPLSVFEEESEGVWIPPRPSATIPIETHREKELPRDSTSLGTLQPGSAYLQFVVSSAALLLLPGLFILSTLASIAGPPLALYHQVLEVESQSSVASDDNPNLPSRWDIQVERLINSANPNEREHVYVGRSWANDYPVLIHRDLYNAHAHIVGDSGSGKTALGVAPLMTQLIARADASHVIIDLKGDPQLFQCAWIEAERAGLPFKYFTTIPGSSSYVFNPFLQGHLRHRTLNQRVQNLLRSLSLDYGQEAYGRSYFSSMHETVLLNYLARYRDIHSFRDLFRYVSDKNSYRDIGDLSEWTEARHLIALLNRVASIEPLNVSAHDVAADSPLLRDAIDMAALPRPDQKQVVYFYLPALEESGTANAIAKLALFALLSAAARREAGRKNGRVYVYLDEFQVIVGSSAVTILEQARSMNVSLLLSHQHRGQLNTPDGDLTPVIEANTQVKQIFKASDLDSMQHLEEEAGQALYHNLNWHVPYNANMNEVAGNAFHFDQIANQCALGEVPQIGVQEVVGPRLERNRIIELSANPMASFIRTTADKGFTAYTGYWTPILSEYHIHCSEYDQRETAPWPEPSESTLVVPLESEHDNRFAAQSRVSQVQPQLFPVGQQEAAPPQRVAADAALKERIRAISAQIGHSIAPSSVDPSPA